MLNTKQKKQLKSMGNTLRPLFNVGKDGITVKCKDRSIVITKLKPSGKKEMKAIDFINGYKKELLGEFFK